MNKYLIALIIIILVVCALILYSYKKIKSKVAKPKTVSKYSRLENYEETQVQSNSTISVLLCYANWCGHCPAIKEWYVDLINCSPIPNVTFTMCEEQDLPVEVLNSIQGFPSILVFLNGQMKKYNGKRTKDDLLIYLKNI
jgi:thiol-disulfide isomerase/thioredoxin